MLVFICAYNWRNLLPSVEVPGIGFIDANGFAEEQTMQRILAAIQNLGEAQRGVGTSGVMSLDAISARAAQNVKSLGDAGNIASKETIAAGQGVSSAAREMARANQRYAAALGATSKVMSSAAQGPLDMIEAIGGAVKKGLDGVFNKMATANSVFINALGAVGDGASTIAAFIGGTLIGDMNKMSKSFEVAQKSGALFGGSMLNYRNSVLAAGLTMDQYNNILTKSGEDMSKFSGTTLTGAQEFARQNSNLIRTQGQDLLRLGLSFEDMGSRTAEFLASLTESGMSIDAFKYDTNSLSQAIKAQVVTQKALTAINGTTLEQEREKMRQQRKDAQLNAVMMGLNDAQRKSIQELSAQFPQASQFIKEFVAFGQPVSREANMQASMMGATTDAIADTLRAIEGGADPKSSIAALKSMSDNSAAIANETAAMADLVKLGVAGSTNSFVKMAEQNFQQQFELSNKLRAGVVENVLAEFDKAGTGFANAADKFTTNMNKLEENTQRVQVELGNLAAKLYGTDGINAIIGTTGDAIKHLGTLVSTVAGVVPGESGTATFSESIVGNAGDTRGSVRVGDALVGQDHSALIDQLMSVGDKLDNLIRQSKESAGETNGLISRMIDQSKRNTDSTNSTMQNFL